MRSASCSLYILVITRARVTHGRDWHSSDVKPEGRSGTRKARVITDLLHEQLAKDLLLYCAPKKDVKFLYRAAWPCLTKNKLQRPNTNLDCLQNSLLIHEQTAWQR